MVRPSHSRHALRGISPEAGVLRGFCPQRPALASWLPQTSFWMAGLPPTLSQEGSYKTFLSRAFPRSSPGKAPCGQLDPAQVPLRQAHRPMTAVPAPMPPNRHCSPGGVAGIISPIFQMKKLRHKSQGRVLESNQAGPL